MNKELNYPVKYAVLELKEVGGYSQGWEDITKGFIASKCFVVESKVKYLSDGSSKVSHKVVFPHKDYKTFKNEPDKICYIAECNFDGDLFVDYVNDNKDKLLEMGGISSANSIKKEIRECLEHDKYFYEYEKNGVVKTIEAKNFDNEMIEEFADFVFEIIDWQCASSFIYENDWEDDIKDYYDNKFKNEEISI